MRTEFEDNAAIRAAGTWLADMFVENTRHLAAGNALAFQCNL
jgi:hypothetical protein